MFPKSKEELEIYFTGCAITGMCMNPSLPDAHIVSKARAIGKLMTQYIMPVDPNALGLAPPASPQSALPFPGIAGATAAPYSPINDPLYAHHHPINPSNGR